MPREPAPADPGRDESRSGTPGPGQAPPPDEPDWEPVITRPDPMPAEEWQASLDHLAEEEPLTVEPLRTFPIIRDLVTDVSWNYEVNKRIPPFTAKPDTEWAIGCFLCQDVCHILRDHQLQSSYFGPRFLVRIASLEMHPLDTLDRLDLTTDEGGLGLCNITKCCTEVCPEGIHITDNAIIPLKERVVDHRYDPFVKLVRRIAKRRRP